MDELLLEEIEVLVEEKIYTPKEQAKSIAKMQKAWAPYKSFDLATRKKYKKSPNFAKYEAARNKYLTNFQKAKETKEDFKIRRAHKEMLAALKSLKSIKLTAVKEKNTTEIKAYEKQQLKTKEKASYQYGGKKNPSTDWKTKVKKKVDTINKKQKKQKPAKVSFVTG